MIPSCAVCSIVALLCGAEAPDAITDQVLADLVATERNFAAMSREHGMKQAFLAYLADSAVLFRPHPVDGRTTTEQEPDAPGILSWVPSFADMSVSGDLGYTTGPWTYASSDTGGLDTAHGHFVSVWKRGADGYWRLLIDLGISHGAPPDTAIVLETGPIHSSRAGEPSDSESVMKADRALSQASRVKGTLAALSAACDERVRVYRPGRFPQQGVAALGGLLAKDETHVTWDPLAGAVATADDLAYTYGSYRLAGHGSPVSGYYLRLWRRSSDHIWRIVLDVGRPVPRK